MAEPTANPNAFGAPASGFGQTISFAFDPAGQPPAAQAPQSQGPRVGASNVSRPQQASTNITPVKVDPTWDLLQRVGGELINRTVDQARTEAYIDGMGQAMQGAALEDIKAQQPWYSKLFGDTPTVEGARAYHAQAQVNNILTEQTSRMDKLQEMDAAQAAEYYKGVVRNSMTGDSGTDFVVMKSLSDAMPSLMKAQAKAHYAWGQNRAVTAMSLSATTGAKALQDLGQLHAEDKISSDDLKIRGQQYVQSLLPPDGMNEENYVKTLASMMRGMAGNNQFHALNAIKDSGFMQALPPDQRNTVEAAILASATKARDKYAMDFAGQLAELKSDAMHPPEGTTPRQIKDRIDQANAAFQKLTGSPVGLFSSDEVGDMVKGTFNAIKSEEAKAITRQQTLADKAATATDKAAAAAEQAAALTRAVANGDIHLAQVMSKATSDEIEQEVYKQVGESKDGGAVVLGSNFIRSGYVHKLAQDRLQEPLRMAEGQDSPTDGWFKSVDLYNQMKASAGGPAYAAAYFGDYAPRLEMASRLLGEDLLNNPNAGNIFRKSMDRSGSIKRDPLTDKERTALTQQIVDQTGSFLPEWLGGKVPLRADAAATLTRLASQTTEDWRGIVSDKEAAQQGIAAAIGNGRVELLGGFAIENSGFRAGGKKPASLRSLMEGGINGTPYTAMPQDKADRYFTDFLHESLKVPKDAGTTKFFRSDEVAGQPQFVVSTLDKDGAALTFRFGADQLREYSANRTTKEAGRTPSIPLAAPLPRSGGWGPNLVFSARENPSPYADAASRAALRERSRNK